MILSLIKAFDFHVSLSLYDSALRHEWLSFLVRLFDVVVPSLFVLVFLGFGLWVYKTRREDLGFLVHSSGVLFGVYGVSWFVKSLVLRLRPYEQFGFTPLVVALHSSFPSSHAALSMGLCVLAFSVNRWLGWFAFVGSILVGLSRVFAGVHYLSDIVVGWALGVLFATLFLLLFRTRLHNKN